MSGTINSMVRYTSGWRNFAREGNKGLTVVVGRCSTTIVVVVCKKAHQFRVHSLPSQMSAVDASHTVWSGLTSTLP